MQSEPDPLAAHIARLRRRFAEKNPLIAAVLDGDTASALQAAQADPAGAAAASCCGGFGALHAAVVANDAELVAALCSAGARDSAVAKCFPQSLMQLSGGRFASEAALSEIKEGRTALLIAMRMHHWPAMEALLAGQEGVLPPSSTLAGNALLAVHHLPSREGSPLTVEDRSKLMQRLLAGGADPLEQLAVPPSTTSVRLAHMTGDQTTTPLFEVCAGAADAGNDTTTTRRLESFGHQMLDAAVQHDQQNAAGALDGRRLAHALYAALCLRHQKALEHFLERAEGAAPAAAPAAVAGSGSAAARQPLPASGPGVARVTIRQRAVYGCAHGMLASALQLAAGQLNERAVRVLVRLGAHGCGLSDAALLRAAHSGHQAILQLLAASGARHEHLAMQAARCGQLAALSALLRTFGLPPVEHRRQLAHESTLQVAGWELDDVLLATGMLSWQRGITNQHWWQPPTGNQGARALEQWAAQRQRAARLWLSAWCPLYRLLAEAATMRAGAAAAAEWRHVQCARMLRFAGFAADDLQLACAALPVLAQQLRIGERNSRLWAVCTGEPAWTPATHALHPPRFRAAARALLLAEAADHRRNARQRARLPDLALHRVLQLAAEAPEAWADAGPEYAVAARRWACIALRARMHHLC